MRGGRGVVGIVYNGVVLVVGEEVRCSYVVLI